MLAVDIDIFDRIIALLAQGGADYRLLEHAPEGRTDIASRIRGNSLAEAAKAMVLAVRREDGDRRFALAVVPGDRRVSFDAVARVMRGRKASLASADDAGALTGCAMGAVPPFSFDPGLHLLVDERLVAEPRIVFNAGRLDRSIFLGSADYRRLASPRIERIAS
jgi:Ala-tRNA(Pro) deacylase